MAAGIKNKIRDLWTSVKKLGWRAWSFIALGSYHSIIFCVKLVWRFWGDEQNGLSLFEQAGGTVPMLISAVESWWLPLVLIPGGLAYGIFVEKTNYTIKYPWIPKLAVISIVVGLVLIISSAIFEIFLAAPNNENIAEYYILGHQTTHLSTKQKDDLIRICKQSRISKDTSFYVSSSNDEDSFRLARSIYDAFSACGMNNLIWLPAADQQPGQQGIMLETIDPIHASQTSKIITSFFVSAHIPFTPMEWPDRTSTWPSFPDFVVYVTPNTPAPP